MAFDVIGNAREEFTELAHGQSEQPESNTQCSVATNVALAAKQKIPRGTRGGYPRRNLMQGAVVGNR